MQKLKQYIADQAQPVVTMSRSSFGAGRVFASKKGSTKYIVGGLVTAVLLTALGPTVFKGFADAANDGNLSAGAKAVMAAVPIFFVLGILYYFINGSGAGKA